MTKVVLLVQQSTLLRLLPVDATTVRAVFSKDYTQEPGFKSLHFKTPETLMLCVCTAKMHQNDDVLCENHIHVKSCSIKPNGFM